MRIIAGEWRGRKLIAPRGDTTRPTADRTRETLFSMLASRLGTFEGLAVADLFAGSGALGLEALSRGAAHCLFVENDEQALKALRANIAAFGARERGDVQSGSVLHLGLALAPLDLILMDPPYDTGAGMVALDKLNRLGWIARCHLDRSRNRLSRTGSGQGAGDRSGSQGRESQTDPAAPHPMSARLHGRRHVPYLFTHIMTVPQTAPNADGEQIPAYASRLNDPQKEAVLTTEGPVLMLAGAGTGKTAALTARLAHLVAMRKAWPSEILCVTFTNKAAREMRERVGAHIGPAVEGMPWLGTFHAIAAKMLRRHAELVGLQSNYTIIDTDDQLRVLKQLIRDNDVDEKRWPPRQLAGLIDGWKNRGLNPGDLDAVDNESYANGQGQKFYTLYQDRLKALNACDFGDLLLHMLNILRDNRDVLDQYRTRFKYILVDEYQDTNAVQYLWLRLLAQERRNICVVGDDDQSIYSWRGAEVANILRFDQDFPGAKVVKLEQNYRSTPQILAAASGLIDANSQRLGKTLWTDLPAGDKVRVIGVWDGPEEARRVGEEIERLEREGAPLEEIAILVRAQYQTREFEDRFIQIGLNYRIIGGFRFYERAEIRDMLAYLRVIAQPADDLAFERIYNQPKRGLGAKTLEKDAPICAGGGHAACRRIAAIGR